jgi:hypothetical protein
MQQRPYLKICGERILGGVGNFQNKLTADPRRRWQFSEQTDGHRYSAGESSDRAR